MPAADPSRYVQRQVTRGPRKGQSGWYDSVGKKFMPAAWKPGAPKQKAVPQAAKAMPKQAAAPPQKQPAQQPTGKAAPPPATQPQQQPKPAITPENAAAFQRIQEAAKKDLSDPSHVLNRRKGELATANFGSGDVRTLRSTKGNPLTKADHEQMDRLHSRAAMALKLAGKGRESRAQLEAAKYHRSGAEKQEAAATPPPQKVEQAKPEWKPDGEDRTFDAAAEKSVYDEQKPLRDSLTDREVNTFNEYSRIYYQSINAVARGQKTPPAGDGPEQAAIDKKRWEEAPERIKAMDAVFARTPEFEKPAYVHRGIVVPKEAQQAMLEGFRRAAESGNAVGFGGYMSTTMSPKFAAQFRKAHNPDKASIVMEVKAKKGVYLSSPGDDMDFTLPGRNQLADIRKERELLMPRDAKYRVVGIKEVSIGGQKQHVVQMEQL